MDKVELVDRMKARALDKARSSFDCGNCGIEANLIDEVVDALTAVERERDEARAENTRLRAGLAHSDQPCAYCSLPAEDWNKCASGFPGCGRADDAMGCPELGASMRATAAEQEAERLRDCLRKDPNVFLMAYEDGDHERLSRAAAKANERATAAEARNAELVEGLKPFAKDADNWADSVPDSYAPRCTEPGNEYAPPGSEAAFTVGDERRARSLIGDKSNG